MVDVGPTGSETRRFLQARGHASMAGRTITGQADRPRLSRIGILSLVIVAFMSVVGGMTSHAVWEAIVQTYSAHLTAILDADIAALDVWKSNEVSFTETLARNPQLRREVEALAIRHELGPGGSGEGQDQGQASRLNDLARTFSNEQDYLGFAVVAADCTLLAVSNQLVPVGTVIDKSKAEPWLTKVFAGQSVMEKPYLEGSYLVDVEQTTRTLILVASPVLSATGQVVAAFVRILDADKDFTRILSVARVGESGDTYAFDEQGYMLSDSRFQEQLQEIGLLPEGGDVRAIKAVQLRDPGGDMTRGYVPNVPLSERPLTRMAAAAIGGESGYDISGYRDYRGVEVIGAWRWLPEMGFGVATEVRKYDAFVGHRPVKIAFYLLLFLLVIGCGWFFYSFVSIHRLNERIAEIRQLGQYRLLDKIGEGGIGEVFKASHALLKRPTAVKLLRPEMVSEEILQRFEREVQLTSRLTHPNTIQVYDYGKTEEGIFYYAMEFVDGINLAELVSIGGPVAPARVVHIIKHLCYSLEEAHGIGLVHRDIKPMNIMLCLRGGVYDCIKVLDFGLVKEVAGGAAPELTSQQMVIGTPAYIAPERLRGQTAAETSSDIYSVGAVAYYLLAGRDVFTAPTAMEVCYHVMNSQPEPPSVVGDRSLPVVLEDLVMSCLAKAPAERPANARAIIKTLEAMEGELAWAKDEAKRWWQTNIVLKGQGQSESCG